MIMNLASGQTGTIKITKEIVDVLPKYITVKVIDSHFIPHLLTRNVSNSAFPRVKFAIAPIETIEGINNDWKGEYIPMSKFSPEDICCELVQGDKTKFDGAFVLPNTLFGIRIAGWHIEYLAGSKAFNKLRSLL